MESFSETQLVDGGFIETGTIVHDGHEYTSGGAYLTNERGIVYVSPKPVPAGCRALGGTVTDWHGNTLGRYSVTSSWRINSYHLGYYTMEAIEVTLTDGRRYHGRYNRDWSGACKIKRCKEG